jgi:hypothetical protein
VKLKAKPYYGDSQASSQYNFYSFPCGLKDVYPFGNKSTKEPQPQTQFPSLILSSTKIALISFARKRVYLQDYFHI